MATAVALCLSSSAGLSAARGRPAASAAGSLALLGGVNLGGLGYDPLPATAVREIAWARRLKAKVVRIEVPWAVMEPNGPGAIEPRALAFTDRLVSEATAAGIRPIVMVDKTPCWASSAPASLLRGCATTHASAANGWPPVNPSAYALFVAYLATRYGAKLAAIEVWNEPDQSNEQYFAGTEKVKRYAALLRAAYTAIKQANPGVLVLGGSLVGANGAFLRALYAAGIKGYYDGLAVHFYTLTIASLRSIHEVQLANGDHTPLWLNEFGWSSCWPEHRIQQEQPCVTPQLQAGNITDTFRALAHLPYVAAAVLYKLQDASSEEFGVLNSAGARKPSYAALAKVFASPLGQPAPVTLRLTSAGGHLLARGSASPGDFMELEAFQGSVPRYRAVFVLNRFNRYDVALPSALGTSGLRVHVFQYGLGSASATALSR